MQMNEMHIVEKFSFNEFRLNIFVSSSRAY